MRRPLIPGTLLCLLAACGGGGDATTQVPVPPPAPAILPGTAGKTIQRLFAVPGPSVLLAGWVEVGDRVLLFRTALWK